MQQMLQVHTVENMCRSLKARCEYCDYQVSFLAKCTPDLKVCKSINSQETPLYYVYPRFCKYLYKTAEFLTGFTTTTDYKCRECQKEGRMVSVSAPEGSLL